MVCGLMACPVTAHATTFNYVLVSSDHHLNTINHETMDGTAATLSRQTDAVIPVNFGNGGWFSRDGSMDVFAEASVAEGLKTRASVTLGAFEQTRPAWAAGSADEFLIRRF